MASIYEIEYKFDDEWSEDRWRTGVVCVYETGTPSGDNLQHALDLANEDDDWSGVDKLLTAMFDLKDDDIVFYYDISDMRESNTSRLTRLAVELQKNFDIIINDIGMVDTYE